MEVTGHQLKQKLTQYQEIRDDLRALLGETVFAFEDEDKPPFQEVVASLEKSESELAALQTLQSEFNLKYLVTFNGQSITLQQAVRLVGGVDRIKQAYKTAAKSKTHTFGRDPNVRRVEEVYAKRTISVPECQEMARVYSKKATQLRHLIQKGNETKIAVPNNMKYLFE